MHQHEHAAHGIDLEEGSAAWSEWVKDYYRDVETYDWVDVADNIRGLEAFFHRNRARVVRGLIAKYAAPDAGQGSTFATCQRDRWAWISILATSSC